MTFITPLVADSKFILQIREEIRMEIPKSRKSAKDARRQEALILALLQNPSVEKAAESVGIHVTTAWRWLKEENFQDQYSAARRQTFRQSVARLQHASGMAVTTLLRVMADPTSPAHSRVRAADSILSHSARAMELEDIDSRLARLEANEQTDSEENR